jgi:hypothetical protein
MNRSNQNNSYFLYSKNENRSNSLNKKIKNSNQIGGHSQKLNEVDLSFLYSESDNLYQSQNKTNNRTNQIKTNNVVYSETSDYMVGGAGEVDDAKISKYLDQLIKGHIQFNNIEKQYRDIYLLASEAVLYDGLNLQYINQIKNSPFIVQKAVEQNGLALQYTSNMFKADYNTVKSAVKKNGLALKYASDYLKDNDEIVKNAVNENGIALKYASDRLKNDLQIVRKAIKENIFALEFASTRIKEMKSIKNDELIKEYINEENMHIKNTNRRELEFKIIKSVCMEARKIKALNEIRKENRTSLRERYNDNLTELKQHEEQLESEAITLADALTEALTEASKNVIRNPSKDSAKDSALPAMGAVIAFVQKDGMNLKYLPYGLRRNKKIVKAAMLSNPMAIIFTSDDIKTEIENDNKDAQRNSILSFSYGDIKSKDDIIITIQTDGMKLEFLSDEHKKDLQIVTEAVKQNSLSLQFVDTVTKEKLRRNNKLKSVDIEEKDYISFVTENGLNLEFIPKNIANYDFIVRIAVEQNPMALQFASEDLQKNTSLFYISIKSSNSQLQTIADAFQHIDYAFQHIQYAKIDFNDATDILPGLFKKNKLFRDYMEVRTDLLDENKFRECLSRSLELIV